MYNYREVNVVIEHILNSGATLPNLLTALLGLQDASSTCFILSCLGSSTSSSTIRIRGEEGG